MSGLQCVLGLVIVTRAPLLLTVTSRVPTARESRLRSPSHAYMESSSKSNARKRKAETNNTNNASEKPAKKRTANPKTKAKASDQVGTWPAYFQDVRLSFYGIFNHVLTVNGSYIRHEFLLKTNGCRELTPRAMKRCSRCAKFLNLRDVSNLRLSPGTQHHPCILLLKKTYGHDIRRYSTVCRVDHPEVWPSLFSRYVVH
jgi:hypothetical protein